MNKMNRREILTALGLGGGLLGLGIKGMVEKQKIQEQYLQEIKDFGKKIGVDVYLPEEHLPAEDRSKYERAVRIGNVEAEFEILDLEFMLKILADLEKLESKEKKRLTFPDQPILVFGKNIKIKNIQSGETENTGSAVVFGLGSSEQIKNFVFISADEEQNYNTDSLRMAVERSIEILQTNPKKQQVYSL